LGWLRRRLRSYGNGPRCRRAAEKRTSSAATERLGGLQVERQFEFDRLLNRQIARLLAAQNAIDVGGRAAKDVEAVRRV
jgi:hypothetical protein